MIRILLLCILSISLQAQQQSLLWEVSGMSLKKPSFLFGTMHVQQLSCFDQSGRIEEAMKKCKVYTMELDMETLNNPSLFFELIMKDKGSLKSMINEDCYRTLDSLFDKQLGIKVSFFDKIIPFFTYILIQKSTLFSEEEGEQASQAMDLWLAEKAKKLKLEVNGLEEVNEQLEAINIISYQEQADYLCTDLKDTSSGFKIQKLIQFYKEETLDSLMVYMDDSKMPLALTEALIYKRNMNMFNRIRERMKKKPHFFAVGAGHLGGENGIIQLLKNAGYTLKPVFKPTATKK